MHPPRTATRSNTARGRADNVEVMELNIPAIHGVARVASICRPYRDFSIYDVDSPIPPSIRIRQRSPHALVWRVHTRNDRRKTGRSSSGTVRIQGAADEQRYASAKGRILRSPAAIFPPAVEPKPGIFDVEANESLQRVGLGTPDVLKTVKALRERGVGFVESQGVHSDTRGALTQSYLGGVMFELVHDERS